MPEKLKWIKYTDGSYILKNVDPFAIDLCNIDGKWVLRIFFKDTESEDLIEWVTQDTHGYNAQSALEESVWLIRKAFSDLRDDMYKVSTEVEGEENGN